MKFSSFNRKNNRKGIIMFVVIGVIIVLGALVFSYNYFVRGKYREGRGIINRIRATKCAQALFNYVHTALIREIERESTRVDVDSGEESIIEVFKKDKTAINNYLNNKFVKEIKANDFINSILEHEEYPINTSGLSSDVDFSCEVDDRVSFENQLDFEKLGYLTLSVKVTLGKSVGKWTEARPFKVICPIPIPITKFTFYLKDGITSTNDSSYGLNSVLVDSSNGKPSNKYPLLLDNGYSDDETLNKSENGNIPWEKRGWIYIGGDDEIYLNRAHGGKGYGQLYHSTDAEFPVATNLIFDSQPMVSPDGNTYTPFKHDNVDYCYKKNEFGFSKSMFDELVNNRTTPSNWSESLGNMKGRRIKPADQPYHWYSSALHLFSNESVLKTGKVKIPTITRVIGKVHDRFLDMGYYAPIGNPGSVDYIYAIVRYHDIRSFSIIELDAFNFISGKKSGSTSDNTQVQGFKGGSLEYVNGYFILKPSSLSYLENDVRNNNGSLYAELYYMDIPHHYDLDSLPSSGGSSDNSKYYELIMSKDKDQYMSETYEKIIHYTKAGNTQVNPEEINYNDILPPDCKDTLFIDDRLDAAKQVTFGGGVDNNVRSRLTNLSIGDISEPDSNSNDEVNLGLKSRTCYKIYVDNEEANDNLRNIIDNCFSVKDESSSGENSVKKLNLANSVLEICSDNESLEINLGNIALNATSSGAIFSKNSISVPNANDLNATLNPTLKTLFVLSSKGEIRLKNIDNNFYNAYFAALGTNGKINFPKNDGDSVKIKGGIAVKDFSPNELSPKGGLIKYDVLLDPTKDIFYNKFVGVVIGPKGRNP